MAGSDVAHASLVTPTSRVGARGRTIALLEGTLSGRGQGGRPGRRRASYIASREGSAEARAIGGNRTRRKICRPCLGVRRGIIASVPRPARPVAIRTGRVVTAVPGRETREDRARPSTGREATTRQRAVGLVGTGGTLSRVTFRAIKGGVPQSRGSFGPKELAARGGATTGVISASKECEDKVSNHALGGLDGVRNRWRGRTVAACVF